ncbi:MAG TPA: ankyrin repeat domain-containing protein [Candidatus Acidoferrales bacterium]|nr:ankyrin repeat domain-containing protein [Candidatus Acidoferrales bacterium]
MSNAAQFFQAIHAGDENTVKALLDAEPALAGAKNERGQSAVLAGVYSGRNAIRDLLLSRGVSLELHEAAAAGQLEKVKQIVGVNPPMAKSYSPDGFPVVALAAAFGHPLVAEYLREKGADVNAVATNGTGYNALTGAVANGHTDIVAWLLANGANASYRYGPGYSPLLESAANGRLEIVKLLLNHGADLRATADDGQTAASLAEARGHKEVAEFLRGRAASA